MVLKNTLSKVTLLSSAVALLALAACGPAPVTPGQPTTGKLNEEELFYLKARGISHQTAVDLLVQGFCHEILGEYHV